MDDRRSVLPNSDDWSLVVQYCDRLAEIVGFSNFLADRSASPAVSNKFWPAWLAQRTTEFVYRRYGLTDDFWRLLRKYDAVVSGSTISLAAWSYQKLPFTDRRSPSALQSDLDIFVPESNSRLLLNEIVLYNDRPAPQLFWIIDGPDVWSRKEPINHPYEHTGSGDLASIATVRIGMDLRIDYEGKPTVLSGNADEPEECPMQDYERTRRLQIIGLQPTTKNRYKNRNDVVNRIETDFDFRFLANTFDGKNLTVAAIDELVNQSGPNRWLAEADCRLEGVWLPSAVNRIDCEFAIKPTTGIAARALMRIAKYWLIDCTTTNTVELIGQATSGFVRPDDVILPNGLPRWISVGDTYKFFASQERYRTWLDVLLAAGVRIWQAIDGIEIVTQADFLNIKRSTPMICNECRNDSFPAYRDGRICVSLRYCRTNDGPPSDVSVHMQRFRSSSSIAGVCELHADIRRFLDEHRK